MEACSTSEGNRAGRREVAEVQRARLLEATAEVAAEKGLRGVTKSEIAARAGVSRATLAERFPSIDDCLLALLDWMLERVTSIVVEAFERESSWSDGVVAGLAGLLAFLDRQPARARVCLLESMALPPAGLHVRARALGRVGQFVDVRARGELSLERQPPNAMPEATIGSVLTLLRRRLLSDEAPPFVSLLGPLTEIVVAPYFGPSAAARAASAGHERSRALLAQRSGLSARGRVEVPDLLRHGNAHRMRACLRYLRKHPGASNRAIGAGIEVSHAGQVSVLLARLHEAGLLEGRSGGAGRPNAWRLSSYGEEVARVLHRL